MASRHHMGAFRRHLTLGFSIDGSATWNAVPSCIWVVLSATRGTRCIGVTQSKHQGPITDFLVGQAQCNIRRSKGRGFYSFKYPWSLKKGSHILKYGQCLKFLNTHFVLASFLKESKPLTSYLIVPEKNLKTLAIPVENNVTYFVQPAVSLPPPILAIIAMTWVLTTILTRVSLI